MKRISIIISNREELEGAVRVVTRKQAEHAATMLAIALSASYIFSGILLAYAAGLHH